MKFTFSVSPNLRQKQSTKRMMLELTIALLVVYAFSLFYYFKEFGSEYAIQALLMMATALGVTFVTEIAWALFKKENLKKYLASSFGWITAIILVLMCPVDTQLYALGMATFFAIFVGRILFGGFGQNIFNPAAVGFAIIFASFAGAKVADVATGATPISTMATGYNWLTLNDTMISTLLDKFDGLWNLFLGWYPGGLGETSTLLLLLLGVILAIRKVIDWRVPLIYLGSIFVLSSALALFCGMSNWLWYPIFHVCTGGVAFGAVFMLSDPVTSPATKQGKCVFALGAGIITVLIRVLANAPEGCMYSILIMNMLTPAIDQAFSGKQRALIKKSWISLSVLSLLGLGSMYLANMAITPAEPKKPEKPKTEMIAMSDDYVNSLSATLDGSEKNADGSTTYKITAEGFAAKEGPNMPDYGHPFEPNQFEITIAADNKTIVSVNVTAMNDTEYFGDKILNAKYLDQFKGKDISTLNEVEKNDVVSGATFSVKSSMRALLEVKKALGY